SNSDISGHCPIRPKYGFFGYLSAPAPARYLDSTPHQGVHMLGKRCALTGATIVACLAFPSMPALADQAPMADPTAPPAMIDALERDLGLTEQQVITRLANEQKAAATEASLSASLGGDSFAGAWLNGDASKLMVATTDAAEAPAIEAKGAQPVVVGRTLAQLTSIKDQLDLAA